jgi:hypothetical protein
MQGFYVLQEMVYIVTTVMLKVKGVTAACRDEGCAFVKVQLFLPN